MPARVYVRRASQSWWHVLGPTPKWGWQMKCGELAPPAERLTFDDELPRGQQLCSECRIRSQALT